MLFLRWWLFYQPVAAFGGGPGGAADAFLLEDGFSGILLGDGSSYLLMEGTGAASTAGEPLGILLTITKAS